MNSTPTPAILAIAAHAGDFVWRCGGTLAKYARRGSRIKIIIASDGLRGEANDYWKTEGSNMIAGRILRQKEARAAAELLGVETIDFWELADYPMIITVEYIERIAHEIRSFRPDVILTHVEHDQYNPDHNEVHLAVRKACAAASGGGFPDPNPISPRQIPIFGFEPQITEFSEFRPVLYTDITDDFEAKQKAMHVFSTQPNMYKCYVRKAEMRGAEAELRGSRKDCLYAECFEIYQPIAATGDLVW